MEAAAEIEEQEELNVHVMAVLGTAIHALRAPLKGKHG
jgi:hypothetical protein